MKILVEQSGYPLANFGDISMLQVAVSRLNQLFPDASIDVFTNAPDRLSKFCPKAQPLIISGRTVWFLPTIGRFYKLLPIALAQHWSEFEWSVRCQHPSLVKHWIQFKVNGHLVQYQALQTFLKSLYEADLVVATGGGYITDAFEELASTVLCILGMAVKLKKPTVMLGQGFGPLEKPGLRRKAKTVLPSIDLITLREERASLPLLKSLGVDPNRVITTGDDAIELAYQARLPQLGNGIGVNLRVANYADVDCTIIQTVREAIHQVAHEHCAALIPVPISEYDADLDTIQKLLKGYNNQFSAYKTLDSPIKIIKQIQHCRVVITGSYHAGIFALAQGIPVIGLAKSKYYLDKFLGLSSQFKVGCKILYLGNPNLYQNIINAVNEMWRVAEENRFSLLEAAKTQIQLSFTAYCCTRDLTSKKI